MVGQDAQGAEEGAEEGAEGGAEGVSQQGCWPKVKSLTSKLRFPVTLEPLIALYTISVGLNEVIRSNLIIEKICQNKLNYTAEVCANLTNLEDTQTTVQENVADYEALYSTISFVPKILYALLAGTWSDQHGRKMLICLPILGQFLACASYGINFFFLTSLPWQFLFLELVNDLCGTYVAYYLAVYSYITDITEDNGRTYRLSVIDGMDYVSTSVGTRISGPLFISLGYYAVFGCSAATCVCALFYLVFFVKESLKKEEVKQSVETPLQSVGQANYGSQSAEEIQSQESSPSANWFRTSFSLIFESLKTVFKPREGVRRLIVLLAIFNFACYIFTYNGTEGTHRYLFAQKKYGWNADQMSTYLFDYRIGYMVSLWILIPILTRVVDLADTTIAIVACITSSVGFILPAVTDLSAPRPAPFYEDGSFVLNWFSIGSFVCLLSPVTTITTRSVISRAVPAMEIGRIYSVLALFSAASGSLVEAAFQGLYAASITTFLGSYLCVLAGLLLITIPINLVIRNLLKKLD